jgi:hypothetical protein
MPVVYLFATTVGLGAYFSGIWKPGPVSDPPPASSNTAPLATSKLVPELPKVDATPPDSGPAPTAVITTVSPTGIPRDTDGLRRKALITGQNVFLRPSPDGDPIGQVLPRFGSRFVYNETAAMLRVGSTPDGAEGWIYQADTAPWNSRLVARPTSRINRPSIEIYSEQSCLSASISGRVCAKHDGRCPSETEGQDEGATTPRIGWPVVSVGTVAGGDGFPREVVEVIPLATETAPTDAERLAPLRPALRQVYVAFVIDTTESMKPSIEQARALASGLAKSMNTQFGDVSLHIGLIEYRDDSPALGFHARVTTAFTEIAGFQAVVNTIEAALHEDAVAGESVIEGLNLALPGTPGGLNWPTGRAGELATKLIVLMGDSPDHSKGTDRMRAVAARAKASGVSIATVALNRSDALSTADQTRLDQQWQILAEQSYRPLDRTKKFTTELPPLAIRADGASSLVPRVQALIEDRLEHARGLSELARAEDEGRLDEYLNSRGLTKAQAAPILEELRRGEIAPKRTQRRTPVLKKGWLSLRMGATLFVTLDVLVSREELETLISRLSTQKGESDELRAIINATAAGEMAFLKSDLRGLTSEEQVKRRKAFPSPIPQSGSVAERLRTTLQALGKIRDETSWSDPRQTVDGRVLIPFDLINF